MLQTLDCVENINACASMAEVSHCFRDAIAGLGMSASASGMVTGPHAATGNIFHFTNWPEAWLKVYAEEDLGAIDPVPRWAIVSGEATSWTMIINTMAPADPGHVVYEKAKAHGFFEGFVTPVRSQNGSLGLVSVGGGVRPPFSLEEQIFLKTISAALVMRAEDIRGYDLKGIATLTAREREIVGLLRAGYTDPEIARQIGISAATVRFHLENARRKVGARNRVALAVDAALPNTHNQ